MSPIAPPVWAFAIVFQVLNGLGIGGYLGGYGPTTRAEWHSNRMDYVVGARMELGLMMWALGLVGNIFHDDELREIRRVAARKQERAEQEPRDEEERDEKGKGKYVVPGKRDENTAEVEKHKKKSVDKHYEIPEAGLFRWILYPHYLCEWIEWGGFWVMAGSGCVPARNFLVNEICTMLPRAYQGKQWYIQRFGKEKIAGKKAIIPGIL
jgi:3-oxo-5-alpha-steroid 4-dehydrogenase 1